MRKILLTLAAVLALAGQAQTEKEVMSVCKTDGTVVEILVEEIEKVEFVVKDMTVKLDNQYEAEGRIGMVTAVEEMDSVDGYFNYRVFGEASSPVLVLRIPSDKLNKTLELAETADVQVVYNGTLMTEEAVGTLKIGKDKFGKTLNINLDATWGGFPIRMVYSGVYEKRYGATGTYRLDFPEGDDTDGQIASVLKRVDNTGGATTFVLSAVNTVSPADFREGDYAVWFSVAASKLHSGSMDLAENANSYTLRVIDYKNGNVVEADATTTGELITYADPMGNEDAIFFRLSATLKDGTQVEAEYYGTTTSVDDLTEVLPVPATTNGFVIVEPSGEILTKEELETIQVREQDGMTYIYFMKNVTDNPDDQFLTPMIAIKTSLINGGTIDISDSEPNTWAVSFQAIRLTSPDNEWMNIATNGTIRVNRENDDYDVEVIVTDCYYTPWNNTTLAGSMNELSIRYVGKASEYTGSK